MAHKPHDSWQIRLAEGMSVRYVSGIHCNYLAIIPAIPSHPPGT